MDSMRSLNRSLPSTRSSRSAPPEELQPAFRQAALAVTNLYKAAANYHDSIRQAGYQEALDDLLKFLDRENLGLQDGEGWRVREWATARYDASQVQQSEEDEEETGDADQSNRSTSPEKPVNDERSTAMTNDQPSTAIEQTLTHAQSHQHTHSLEPQQPLFQFAAGQENLMQTDDSQPVPTESRPNPVRLELTNRPNRNSHKHNRHNTRPTNRSTAQAASSKRKMPFPDLAEIFNVNFDKKDGPDGGNGSGGSKKTRFV